MKRRAYLAALALGVPGCLSPGGGQSGDGPTPTEGPSGSITSVEIDTTSANGISIDLLSDYTFTPHQSSVEFPTMRFYDESGDAFATLKTNRPSPIRVDLPESYSRGGEVHIELSAEGETLDERQVVLEGPNLTVSVDSAEIGEYATGDSWIKPHVIIRNEGDLPTAVNRLRTTVEGQSEETEFVRGRLIRPDRSIDVSPVIGGPFEAEEKYEVSLQMFIRGGRERTISQPVVPK